MTYVYDNSIRNGIWHYDGPLPIDTADAVEACADGAVRLRTTIVADLDDLIALIGVEGWQEYLDERTGLVLGSPEAVIDPEATAALDADERLYRIALTLTAGLDPEDIDAEAETSQVRARFHPEAWQNDYAVPVDPEGETIWFVSHRTADAIGRAQERGGDLDFVQFDAFAPKWVRRWGGPFTIEVVQSAP